MGGASVLYWLTRLGWKNVVLCERADLTSGSTFHSADLVRQLRGSLSLTKMMMNSVDLYRTLGDEVGLETGWREVGSLRLASSEERRVTSGGYGYTVGSSIAYAYVPAEDAEIGTPVEIEIFGDWITAEVAREPLYDPEGKKIRAAGAERE